MTTITARWHGANWAPTSNHNTSCGLPAACINNGRGSRSVPTAWHRSRPPRLLCQSKRAVSTVSRSIPTDGRAVPPYMFIRLLFHSLRLSNLFGIYRNTVLGQIWAETIICVLCMHNNLKRVIWFTVVSNDCRPSIIWPLNLVSDVMYYLLEGNMSYGYNYLPFHSFLLVKLYLDLLIMGFDFFNNKTSTILLYLLSLEYEF
jgi:hypothetical protein